MGLISFYYFYNECVSVLLPLGRSNLASLSKHDFPCFTTCRFQCYVSNIININAYTKVFIKVWNSSHQCIQYMTLKITGKGNKDHHQINHFSMLKS